MFQAILHVVGFKRNFDADINIPIEYEGEKNFNAILRKDQISALKVNYFKKI